MFDKTLGFYLTLRYNFTSWFIYKSFILFFLILILNYLISLYLIILPDSLPLFFISMVGVATDFFHPASGINVI